VKKGSGKKELIDSNAHQEVAECWARVRPRGRPSSPISEKVVREREAKEKFLDLSSWSGFKYGTFSRGEAGESALHYPRK